MGELYSVETQNRTLINKGKVKVSLFLIKQYAMKAYGVWRYSISILDLGI